MPEKTVFTIEGLQQEQLNQFVEEHRKCRCCSAGEKFYFTFIPTMLGDVVTVGCTCGKKIDLSNI